ncbi:MAG: hypothetical protein H6706_14975 [Myxococcales bacterium]|nr:hypothetical protein [Myxococcales bacterium]
MTRWGAGLLALALLACDDGGGDAADAALPPGPDAAVGPPPPPPLTGLYRVATEVTGGDCAPDRLPAALTFDVEEADGRLAWGLDGLGFSGDRDGGAFTAAATGTLAGCPVTVEAAGTVRAPGNAFTLTGEARFAADAACAPACTLRWVGRAGRIGGHGPSGWTTLALDGDEAVEAAAEFRGQAWFATRAAGGGRLWRLQHENGVPTLTVAIDAGFRSEDAVLAGENVALRSLARGPDALYVGTEAASEGDGFDLWRFDGTSWAPLTVDGFGDAGRVAADALAWHDDALFVGVRHADGAQIWRLADGAPAQLYPGGDPASPAEADGPLDPRGCAPEVTSLLAVGGVLHAAVGGEGCPAFVLRLDDAAAGRWALIAEGGLGVGAERVTLATDGTGLFALAGGQATALLRWVADRQWQPVATDGFGQPGTRWPARAVAPAVRGLLLLPVDGPGGGAVWATGGGEDPRDLTRIAAGEPLHPGAGLGPALVFEERLYVGTTSPGSLLRSTTLLAEQGAGTIRTARDRYADQARGAATACHRTDGFFNPALQHDARARVVLPPGVGPDDNVLLTTLYVLAPDLGAPAATPGEAEDPRIARGRAWLDAAGAAYGGLTACLFGRRGTLACNASEADADCLARCLAAVPALEVDADGAHLGDALGAEGAAAVLAALGDPATLPVTERFALVLVDAPLALDAPDGARYAPVVAGRDAGGELWPGERGAWQAAVRATVAEVERCWPAAIRADPNARYVMGAGAGAFGAIQTLLAHEDDFNGALVVDGRFSLGALRQRPGGRGALAGALPLTSAVAGRGSLPALVAVADPADACSACEAADLCAAWAIPANPGEVVALGGVPGLAAGLLGLSRLHQGTLPPAITCDPPADCAACRFD